MKTLLISLLAAAVLCLPAGAIELPDGLDAVVPQELLEDAMEEGLVARGAAYLWEMLHTSLSDAPLPKPPPRPPVTTTRLPLSSGYSARGVK